MAFVPGAKYQPNIISGIHCIRAKYGGGVAQGDARIYLMDTFETVLEGNFVNGKLHGLVRGLSFNEKKLTFVGSFHEGQVVGNCWKGM